MQTAQPEQRAGETRCGLANLLLRWSHRRPLVAKAAAERRRGRRPGGGKTDGCKQMPPALRWLPEQAAHVAQEEVRRRAAWAGIAHTRGGG